MSVESVRQLHQSQSLIERSDNIKNNDLKEHLSQLPGVLLVVSLEDLLSQGSDCSSRSSISSSSSSSSSRSRIVPKTEISSKLFMSSIVLLVVSILVLLVSFGLLIPGIVQVSVPLLSIGVALVGIGILGLLTAGLLIWLTQNRRKRELIVAVYHKHAQLNKKKIQNKNLRENLDSACEGVQQAVNFLGELDKAFEEIEKKGIEDKEIEDKEIEDKETKAALELISENQALKHWSTKTEEQNQALKLLIQHLEKQNDNLIQQRDLLKEALEDVKRNS